MTKSYIFVLFSKQLTRTPMMLKALWCHSS